MMTLSTRVDGRRPKSAKARNRGKGTRPCGHAYGDLFASVMAKPRAAAVRGRDDRRRAPILGPLALKGVLRVPACAMPGGSR
jgi:hypothetical protein